MLEGLDVDAVRRLVKTTVPTGASEQFLNEIHGQTGGNPLFVHEVLFALETSGIARSRRAESDDLGRVGVPDGVQAVLARRLARLGPEVTETLWEAALIGPEFGLEVLEALMEPEDPLVSVEAGLRAGLLVDHGDDRLAFSHALVHDAIYELRSGPRRSRAHRRIAALLEERPELGASAAELARHWTLSGDTEHARSASLRAAETAESVGAFAEALRHYQRAIELWPSGQATTNGDLKRTLEASAEAARWSGEPGTAVELIRRALALGDGATDGDEASRGRLHERLGRYLWEAADWEASFAAYEEAVRLLEPLPSSVERARALAGQAGLLMLRERYGASLARAEAALEVSRAAGARREEGHALNTFGVDLGMLGRIDESLLALGEALRIAEEVHDLEGQCRAYCNLPALLIRAGRTSEAAELGLTGYRFARQHGLERSGAPIVAANAAAALARLGRWDHAEALAAESLTDDVPPGVSAYLRIVRAELRILRGDLDLARRELTEAEAIVKDAFEPELIIGIYAAQTELALAEGDLAAARHAVETGLSLVEHDEDGARTLRLCSLGIRIASERTDPADIAWAQELATRASALATELTARGRAVAGGGRLCRHHCGTGRGYHE